MTESISALRRRMIEDMNARGLSVARSRRISRAHLAEEKVSITMRNVTIIGVKFLFRATLKILEVVWS